MTLLCLFNLYFLIAIDSYSQKCQGVLNLGLILYYKIQSVCVIVCLSVCLFMWNRLPNHAHYGDESFTGDSVGLGLGHGLDFFLKNLF